MSRAERANRRAKRAERRDAAREERRAFLAARQRRSARERRPPARLGGEGAGDYTTEEEDEVGAEETETNRLAAATAAAAENPGGLRVRFTLKRRRSPGVDGAGAGPSSSRPRVRAAQAPALASSAPPRALRATRSNAAFAWLLRDRAAPGSYAPQLGDEVAYIARGHWEHLSGRNDKRASRPWRFVPGLRHVEPAKVVQLRYRISQDGRDETVARMRLKLADPGSENRGAEFDVDLPPLGDDADFVIPLARYREALAKKWRPDDPCAVVWRDFEHEETWYYGVVHAQNPDVDAQWRGSPWNALVVEYYNTPNPSEKFQMHSFWELHDPADVAARTRQERRREDRGGGGGGGGDEPPPASTSSSSSSSFPEALRVALLTKTEAAARDRRFAVFAETVGCDVSFPQMDGSSANYCSIVPLPMALDTIARRLRAGYYRQPESFAHDVETIRRNCERFNGAASEYSKLAAALEETLASDVPPTNRDASALGVEPTAAVGDGIDADGTRGEGSRGRRRGR